MEYEPDLSPLAWALLGMLRTGQLRSVRSNSTIGAIEELEQVGYVANGAITAEGTAAHHRRERLR